MKVKFTENVTVLATKYEPELYFKKGSVHDLRDDKAWRWIKRDKAFHYVTEVVAPKIVIGRPMMGGAGIINTVMDETPIADIVEPQLKPKRGRPKKGA